MARHADRGAKGAGARGAPATGRGGAKAAGTRGGNRSRAASARTGGRPDRFEGGPRGRGTAPAPGLGGDQVEGRHAVRELLAANRRQVKSLQMAEGMDAAAILDEIEALATTRRVRVEYVSRRRIDSAARTDAAQGVVALARPIEETPLEVLCEPSPRGRVPFLLVLDGITDPHNLGAVLRSAECAGVTGIVLPRHRSVHLSPTVAKVAAGAIEYLPMALVAGIPTALQKLSSAGVWTVGLVGEAEAGALRAPARGPTGGPGPRVGGSRPGRADPQAVRRPGVDPPARHAELAQRLHRGRHRLLRRGPPAVVRAAHRP